MFKDRAIIFLALGQTFIWAGVYYIFPALFLHWEHGFAWSKAQITGAISLAILMSAAFSPLAGHIIDKGNAAVMIFSATLVAGLCLLALSLVSELGWFYLVWVLIGVCMAGCLYDPCFAIITRCRGEKAKHGIIVVTLVAGFAGTISFPTAHSIAEYSSWNNAVRFFAAVIIFIAAPLTLSGVRLLERPDDHQYDKRISKPPAYNYHFLQRPVFWLLALAFAMIAVLQGITIHHLLPILHDRGVHANIAVIAASFIGPMQVLGRLAMMAIEKQVSNHQIMIYCFLTMACAIVLLYFSGISSATLVCFVILFGSGYGIVSIMRPVIAREFLGQSNFGAKFGVLSSTYLTGSAISPYLGALIWGLGGYELVMLLLVGFAALGMAMYLLANRFSTH